MNDLVIGRRFLWQNVHGVTIDLLLITLALGTTLSVFSQLRFFVLIRSLNY